jgi:chemotaxis protein methyltransferase CheR
MRWPGFRKVRRQVCKRLRRRLAELDLPDLEAYRAYLERDAGEWATLESLTRITISRFNRDRGVFACLEREVLPALADDVRARGGDALVVWSAGCASGEEPYTLAILWQLSLAGRFPGLTIRILATDADATLLARARRGCYGTGSVRELPAPWRAAAFVERAGSHCLRDDFKVGVRLVRHDIRRSPPNGPFDLVLCRNLAFTYFDLAEQRVAAARIGESLRGGGALVVGAHEALPEGVGGYEPWGVNEPIYRRLGSGRR